MPGRDAEVVGDRLDDGVGAAAAELAGGLRGGVSGGYEAKGR